MGGGKHWGSRRPRAHLACAQDDGRYLGSVAPFRNKGKQKGLHENRRDPEPLAYDPRAPPPPPPAKLVLGQGNGSQDAWEPTLLLREALLLRLELLRHFLQLFCGLILRHVVAVLPPASRAGDHGASTTEALGH